MIGTPQHVNWHRILIEKDSTDTYIAILNNFLLN